MHKHICVHTSVHVYGEGEYGVERGCELEVWVEVSHYSKQMLMCVYEDQCVLMWYRVIPRVPPSPSPPIHCIHTTVTCMYHTSGHSGQRS